MRNLKMVLFAASTLTLCTQVQAIDVITDGDTTLSIGGYIKAEGMFISPDDKDSSFEGNIRESRVNLKATKLIDDKPLTGFIESDFYGDFTGYDSGTPQLRLRHAYLQYDKFTLGKTWSGQFFAVAPRLTEQLDFYGTGFGTVAGSGLYVRPDLTVHYVNKGLRLTAQDPVYDEANLPDMVVSYSDNIADLGYTAALTGREAGTSIEDDSDSEIGVGASLAAKYTIGDGSIHGSVYTGKGMGVYSGVCTTGALTPVSVNCDAEDGKLVSQTGFSVGYRHQFTPKLRGNMRYGEVNVDNDADTSIDITSANLIYSYLPDLDVGIEWRDRSETTLPWRLKGQEVEVMAKYKF